MMKKSIKKLPLFLIISISVIVLVSLSIVAFNALYDFSNDGKVDDGDVIAVMQSITGNKVLTEEQKDLADFNYDDTIDVLDVIALKRYVLGFVPTDNWTIGVY